MYKLRLSGRFKKAYKKCMKRGYDKSLFEEVVSVLMRGDKLPEKYKNHPLHGNYEGWNDCHILPDWILVWRYDNDELVLCLLDTGTHHDVAKSFDYYLSIADVEETENYTFDISLNDVERTLFAKVNKCVALGDICYIRQCIKTGNDKEFVLQSDVPMPLPWKKTLKGKGMERYLIRENNVYLKYGDWLARNWKNKDFYERPKIAIREAGKQITACLDTEHRYFLSSLYSLYPKDGYDIVDLKYLLGLLNSKMATYFVTKIAFDLTQGAFTKMRTNQLARLPIPQCLNKESIGVLVDEIMKKKSEDSQLETSALENQIDFIVYHLYGLTYDEVLVIDSNPPFSREEYEVYQKRI